MLKIIVGFIIVIILTGGVVTPSIEWINKVFHVKNGGIYLSIAFFICYFFLLAFRLIKKK
ncbi:MAG: hypothetical protein COB83_09745 [Gammaproteobacteria bacterium]|nr:MAG: hypothetical protein COB83_09745 [Gammaproteobacteria bacterium]